MSATDIAIRPRGGPLVMLALVLTMWTGARAVWWENPFAPIAEAMSLPIVANAAAPPPLLPVQQAAPDSFRLSHAPRFPVVAVPTLVTTTGYWPAVPGARARLAAGQQFLWSTALRQPLLHSASMTGFAFGGDPAQRPPPFLPPPPARDSVPPPPPSRWTLDAWAFWRQGSNSAPISQGRVPIYGASQVGTLLQYRLAEQAARDPRLYARAYRALVPRGESELALGASLRPLPALPLRTAGELRLTDTAFGTELRPSAYAVSELAPVSLPYGAQMEAYAQAGWVGGASATAFADGQASVTRRVDAVSRATGDHVQLSIGAGTWGGAQSDAQRIDVGPTMRFDVTLGAVPARFSIDWRERVGGQAGPDSGLAATLSARF